MILNKNNVKIYIAGHSGMVGSAIHKRLKEKSYTNIILADHSELDLEDYKKTEQFILKNKPDIIFIAAAKVGGINANNSFPVDFLMNNLSIQYNIIKSANKAEIDKVFFLGSSCIYPSNCNQPIKEDYLLTSSLEKTNQPYAIAKIAGIEMCWSYNRQFKRKYLAVMPSNLYGVNDNYDLNSSHVLPALINKIHHAKVNNDNKVVIWGSGKPRREFLYADDLADALIFLMELGDNKIKKLVDPKVCPLINIGSGKDQTIDELAKLIANTIGYDGKFEYNKSMPDGTFQKLLDITKIKNLGWAPEIDLNSGIKLAYNDFLEKNKIQL